MFLVQTLPLRLFRLSLVVEDDGIQRAVQIVLLAGQELTLLKTTKKKTQEKERTEASDGTDSSKKPAQRDAKTDG